MIIPETIITYGSIISALISVIAFLLSRMENISRIISKSNLLEIKKHDFDLYSKSMEIQDLFIQLEKLESLSKEKEINKEVLGLIVHSMSNDIHAISKIKNVKQSNFSEQEQVAQ